MPTTVNFILKNGYISSFDWNETFRMNAANGNNEIPDFLQESFQTLIKTNEEYSTPPVNIKTDHNISDEILKDGEDYNVVKYNSESATKVSDYIVPFETLHFLAITRNGRTTGG